MKNRARKLVGHPLFTGSAVMIVGTNLANFFAYIYHLLMGRFLGPESYGELVALISLLGIVVTTFGFLGLVVVKFVSASKDNELQGIFTWFSNKSIVLGMVVALVFALLTPYFSAFLKINYIAFVLLALVISFSIVSTVYRSFLQGLLRFKEFVVITNIDITGRLLLGLLLIYFGLSVKGALIGYLLSAFISFLLVRYFLREYRSVKEKVVFNKVKEMLFYAIPMFLVSVATLSFFSTDIILVKHFFSSHDAGIYAALSALGKIIFFGASPVAAVMFPMVSQRKSRGFTYRKIFLLGLLMTISIISFVLFVYWLLPELSILILYGNKYLDGVQYLLRFALFMGIFTLCSYFLSYFMAQGKTKVSYFITTAAMVQAVGIWLYHGDIFEVIKVSTVAVSLLLGFLILYFGYEIQKKPIK
jgi:O-antigen/teichoic acid export membrane protein